MRILCLVGKSGTGKSFKAMQVASENNIDCIIDDGLLIYKCKVIGGVSAKKEKTKMAAVKRAIFHDENHREEVKAKLNEINPDSILIIGTSTNMIDHIVEALGLDKNYDVIKIEDISTKEEIEIARKHRLKEGKHVIPVPVFEVKKSFSGYFLDSIKNFIMKDNKKEIFEEEKTIVRPRFSYLGKFTINERVIKQIVTYIVETSTNKLSVDSVKIKQDEIGVEITVSIVVKEICKLDKIGYDIMKKIKEDAEYITGLNVENIKFIYKHVKS